MAASSTQGTGVGAAFGKSKNTYEQALNAEQLVGIHAVATGSVQLTSTSKVIKFPYSLEKSHSSYVVVTTTDNAVSKVTGKADDSDSKFAYFTLGGTSADTVSWVVFDTGV